MSHHKLYVAIVATVFVALTVVFLFFPRSTYSELEKRQLDSVPTLTLDKLVNNTYTSELSHWFSDTEPYRDVFMSHSMQLRKALGLKLAKGEEAITFHAPEPTATPAPPENATEEEIEAYEQELVKEENAKMANNGIIVIGEGDNVRALMAYGGSPSTSESYIKVVNDFAAELPGVKVYSVVVPLASEFYTPDKAMNVTRPQKPVVEHVRDGLNGVTYVDAYGAISKHLTEPVYLRTDHHWSPLGAYYVAREMARTAGVPFADLSTYTEKVVHRFVGTMYGYSKDISVKNAPEDFVYYVPTTVEYTTHYNNYNVNGNYQVTSEGREYEGPFFYSFKDGSGAAYSTFMGSDMKLTRVNTSTHNGRRAMIIKDSYGNAVPGYLFSSFEEVHVVDFRYFSRNIKKYIEANGITDVFFVTNIFNIHSASFRRNIPRFLTQSDNAFYPSIPKSETSTDEPSDTDAAPSGDDAAEQPSPAEQPTTATQPDVTAPEAPTETPTLPAEPAETPSNDE